MRAILAWRGQGRWEGLIPPARQCYGAAPSCDTRTMPAYTSFHSQGWKGLAATEWLEQLEPLQDWLDQPGDSIVDLPNRQVRRLATPQGGLYIKLLTTGSSLGGAKGALNDVKWFLRPSRALKILNISRELLEAGFHCPIPILAARRRSPGGWPQDVFVSHECEGTPLPQLLSELPAAEVRAALAKVAKEISRLHQAGFVHGDCIPGNIALAPSGQVIFFDHDRTVRSTLPGLARYKQRRNLIQFGFRLRHILSSPEHLDYFLAQYATGQNWPAEVSAWETTRVMKGIRRRLQLKLKRHHKD